MRIQNMQSIISHGNITGRTHVAQMLDAGMDRIDPYGSVMRLTRLDGSILTFEGKEFELDGDPRSGPARYDLSAYRRVIVIGAAKGIQRCVLALEERLGTYLTGGHVIAKHGEEIILKKVGVTLAGHPAPDEGSQEGCEKIFEWIRDVDERDFVITVTGSGVSSLMTWPIEGIGIAEMREITRKLQIEKGMITRELNPIRVHLDRFKGGKILRYLQKATAVHLCTNDLGGSSWTQPGVRDTYDEVLRKNCFIPTIADCSSFSDAIESLRKYNALEDIPQNVRDFLLRADPRYETVKIDEYERMNARLFKLLPKLHTVYPAVMDKARELGYVPHMLAESMISEAAEAGKVMASIALNIQNMNQPVQAPCVLISSGELIVTVGSEKGIGGRNQEFCLAAAQRIAGSRRIVVGAVDTDGTDGPGGGFAEGAPDCLSGALVDGFTEEEAKARGIDLNRVLRAHAASEPLWRLDSGIYALPGISVLDLRIILIA